MIFIEPGITLDSFSCMSAEVTTPVQYTFNPIGNDSE